VAGLAPGADHVQRLSCAAPYNGTPGAYAATATVTRYGDLVDPDTSNNTATAPLQVNGPDLVVSSLSAPATAATMRGMPVTFTVSNVGAGGAPAGKVGFILVASTTTPAAAALLGNVDVPAIPPGGVVPVTATLIIPGNTVPGTYLVRATADWTGTARETNEANNVAHSQPVAVAGPDLALAGYSLPAFATQGQTVTVSLTIANQGLGDASRGFPMHLVLTRDGSACTPTIWCDESDDDWWFGGPGVTQALVAGQQVTIEFPLTVPADFIPVTWNVIAAIDGGTSRSDSVRESNEGNNKVLLGSIVVAPASTTRIVGIDIKPGSFPNSINLGSGGVVPVAILGSADFDATSVNPVSVTLESSPIVLRGNGTPSASPQDVNGDGFMDLVVHVATSTLALTTQSTEAVLQGSTYAGQAIAGTDTVNIVP
jgi:hypothetical protein